MKDLLNSKDLLKEKRVIDAYNGLLHPAACFDIDKTHVIIGSLADVAFEFRDHCIGNSIAGGDMSWNNELGLITGNGDTYNLLLSDERQWVLAGVMCYEKFLDNI